MSNSLVEKIKTKAVEIGFDLVGIASVEPSKYSAYLRQWLDEGKAGSMHWLVKRFEERTNPGVYFPGVRSIISVAVNYHAKLQATASVDSGRIARYALGDDYHEVMTDRLRRLADWVREVSPGTQTRASVDTAPVMEKEIAARAGIGWIGKNTCTINEKIGSYVVLGQVFTTLELPIDQSGTDRCGSCTRCIDACPTQALTAEYQMDAARCISYLTIEHRGEIATELQKKMGDWLYGCDICQEVCPWNRKAPETTDLAFIPRFKSGTLESARVLAWTDTHYQQALKGSAIKRVKLPMLQRNARIVVANST